jgi:glycosyltransferase involved in cell wall biosynthesis
MTAATLPPIDTDLPGLLQTLQAQVQAGDTAGQRATLDLIGPARTAAPVTLVGALCIGGVGLARQLVAGPDDALDAEGRTALVLHAFAALVEPPADAPADHEHALAQALIDGFGLDASAASLLDTVRAAFLIDEAPLSEVPQAVMAAMRHQQWDLALRGLTRVRHSLQDATPRDTCGLAAMCLHKLGRFAEADQWMLEGLGDDAKLLHIGAVRSEKDLLRRWGHAKTPVISIICTTYNHERYIDSAIRGFLSQDCSHPFEILIHDDASTDRTQDVIRRWQAQYPRLIKPLLQTENQKSRGVHPFELLLARARGSYVATCEGDDFWIDPSKLQRQVSYLMAHPDVSCSAHNYVHFVETTLTVKPWTRIGKDFFVSQRQLMAAQVLLWMPTLVFRKSFSALPPERALAAFGDQFLTSYLGTLGRCAYFETLLGAVRRENEFSSWSPLPNREKERRRVKTWTAMLRLQERLGNAQAVSDLLAKIQASPLDAALKASIVDASAPSPSQTPSLSLSTPTSTTPSLAAA